MTNIIAANSNEITMTSLELVDYINSERSKGESELQHKHFCEKVPKVLGEERSAELLADLPDSYGRPRKGYRFPKREACLMAMSYSYDLQAKVFDRMTALEAKLNGPAIDPMQILADPAAMRGLLLTYTEKVLALESTVAEQAPKVAALDRISTAEGSMCITNTAKTLQIQPKVLFGWMQEKDWIYRRAGGAGYVAYQPRLKQGVLEHKVTTVERSDGSVKSVEQVLVTAKGLSVLAQQFSAGSA